MALLKNIFVHHSGGVANDNYASSLHLSHQDIEEYHKQKWNYPGALKRYGGYNISIDPKMASFFQHRAIGEETIAQKGNNFDSISICIIGNYNRKPDGTTVDKMTVGTVLLLEDIILAAFKGTDALRNLGLVIKPDTQLNLDVSRIYPHRHVAQTDCYGKGLADDWARQVIIKAMTRTKNPTALTIEEYEKVVNENVLLKKLLQLYVQVMDLYQNPKLKAAHLGDESGECIGFMDMPLPN
jgi:hypothetical protein